MKDEIKEIKFIKYNGIEGYIELMKHDVEPLNNPECKSIELYYNGKDIKALLDYITNLQEENHRLKELCDKYEEEHSTTFEYWKRLVKEDYKSRNKKAIEYINNHRRADLVFKLYLTEQEVDKVLNILQEDKDE